MSKNGGFEIRADWRYTEGAAGANRLTRRPGSLQVRCHDCGEQFRTVPVGGTGETGHVQLICPNTSCKQEKTVALAELP